MAIMVAGQGFSITALMGILMVVGIAVRTGSCSWTMQTGVSAREWTSSKPDRGCPLAIRTDRNDQLLWRR